MKLVRGLQPSIGSKLKPSGRTSGSILGQGGSDLSTFEIVVGLFAPLLGAIGFGFLIELRHRIEKKKEVPFEKQL